MIYGAAQFHIRLQPPAYRREYLQIQVCDGNASDGFHKQKVSDTAYRNRSDGRVFALM